MRNLVSGVFASVCARARVHVHILTDGSAPPQKLTTPFTISPARCSPLASAAGPAPSSPRWCLRSHPARRGADNPARPKAYAHARAHQHGALMKDYPVKTHKHLSKHWTKIFKTKYNENKKQDWTEVHLMCEDAQNQEVSSNHARSILRSTNRSSPILKHKTNRVYKLYITWPCAMTCVSVTLSWKSHYLGCFARLNVWVFTHVASLCPRFNLFFRWLFVISCLLLSTLNGRRLWFGSCRVKPNSVKKKCLKSEEIIASTWLNKSSGLTLNNKSFSPSLLFLSGTSLKPFIHAF